jgi:uroporphyrinogen-III synthase
MRTFSGRTIALLESRKSGELAAMVRRLGGVPVSVPAVCERPSSFDAGPVIARVIAGEFSMAVVLTGAAVATLLAEAERRSSLDAVRRALGAMTLVCRGPKPLMVLRQHGLGAALVTVQPHTTRELAEALADIPLDRTPLMLLHYGARNEPFAEVLRARGALVEDVCLYEWALPQNLDGLRELVRSAIAGCIDAMLFTSQIQFRHLHQIATEMGVAEELLQALRDRIVVGAVGPVCAGALRDEAIVADVLPASPHSPALVGAVADYFELFDPRPAGAVPGDSRA